MSSHGALMRRLAWTGFALMLLVTLSSAYLRLRAVGLGCEDWPHCYGRPSQAESGTTPAWTAAARVAHRVSASVAGALALLLAALAHTRREAYRRALPAGVALVALAAMLAFLGRATPQAQVAAVAMANLLGGMCMSALFVVLAVGSQDRGSARRGRLWPLAGVALALTCLQLAYGAMTSASYSGLACTSFPDCAGAWWPPDAAWSAFDPWRSISRGELSANMTLHMMHRYGGALLGVVLLWLGLRLIRHQARLPGSALIALVLAQWAIGTAMVERSLPIALALAHNLVAGLILALLAGLALTVARTKDNR